MLLAILSDIHGNLPALEAVLAELEADPVDELVCLGDVAVGPQPTETLDRIRTLGCPVVTRRPHRIPGTPRRTLFVLPSIADDLPAELKNAIAIRNQTNVDGRCPDCGAVASVHPDPDHALIFHAVFEHEPECGAPHDHGAGRTRGDTVSPIMKLCNGCSRVFPPADLPERGRCRECLRDYYRERRKRRGSTAQRGYDNEWRKLSEQAIAAQPYCSVCGTTDDLTTDHVDPRTRGMAGLTLNDVQVLCRFHNSQRARLGKRSPTTAPQPPTTATTARRW